MSKTHRQAPQVKPEFKFYVGYHDDLHANPLVNFQMNRYVCYLGESGLEDMRALSPKLKDFPSWRQEFINLAKKSLAKGRDLHAGYYYRAAEFFMWEDDPDKLPTRKIFFDLVHQHYGIKDSDKYAIPYTDGKHKGVLPAYRFTPKNPKDTIVMFGGFDSYIEEWFPILFSMRDAGYDVIIFEGPGQGGAREDAGLPLTHEWHKPVKTVLDYFNLTDVTLFGISMGAGLVIRAAAFEPRAKRVVACDSLFDILDCWFKRLGEARNLLEPLFRSKDSTQFNNLLNSVMEKDMFVDWIMRQGMHITGTSTPYDYLERFIPLQTGDISHLLKQDVLLLWGTEDVFGITSDQLFRQIEALTNVRSITARVFTRTEHAQNHCQVGNIKLLFDVIFNWVDFTKSHS